MQNNDYFSPFYTWMSFVGHSVAALWALLVYVWGAFFSLGLYCQKPAALLCKAWRIQSLLLCCFFFSFFWSSLSTSGAPIEWVPSLVKLSVSCVHLFAVGFSSFFFYISSLGSLLLPRCERGVLYSLFAFVLFCFAHPFCECWEWRTRSGTRVRVLGLHKNSSGCRLLSICEKKYLVRVCWKFVKLFLLNEGEDTGAWVGLKYFSSSLRHSFVCRGRFHLAATATCCPYCPFKRRRTGFRGITCHAVS